MKTLFKSRKRMVEDSEAMMRDLRKQSQWKDVWRRLCRNKPAMVSLVVIIVLILVCTFAEYVAPYGYAEQNLSESFQYPSWAHLMGTDQYGRDLFSRIIYGGRISLVVAISSMLLSVAIGCPLGAIAAYFGGWFESIVMRIFDVIMAIPGFLLAVSVQSILGSGIQNAAVAIAVANIPMFARVTRSAVLTVKDQEFVEAARSIGAGNMRIIFREILPNTLATIIVNATLMLGAAILTISSLSFVGLGVQLPIPEWGSILASGRQYIRDFYPLVVFPGLAIMITLIAFNLLGDGLRDALDPKLKQ